MAKNNGNGNQPKEEVKREDVLKYAPDGLYNPHFTEKTVLSEVVDRIINKAPFFVKEVKWNKGAAVFADLSFEQETVGKAIPASKGQKPVKVVVKAVTDDSKKQVNITIKIGDFMMSDVLKNITIKKGFINFNEAFRPDMVVEEEMDNDEERGIPSYLNPNQMYGMNAPGRGNPFDNFQMAKPPRGLFF